MFKFPFPRAITFGAAAIAALGIAGCGQSIEQNKIFAKQQKTVNSLEKNTIELQRQFDELNAAVAKLKDDVQVLRNSPQSTSGLENRLTELQRANAENTLNIANLEKKIAAVPATRPVAAPEPVRTDEPQGADASKPKVPATPKPTPKAEPTPGPRKTPAKPEGETPGRVTRSTGSPSPVKGEYYTVKPGDTVESIAAAHGTTASKLSELNNPDGRPLKIMAGQQIYVPKR